MGPINTEWIKEHGDHWATGRMDLDGPSLEPFGGSYGVDPMHQEDWSLLGDWCIRYQTEELKSLEEVIEDFEKETGNKIRWK